MFEAEKKLHSETQYSDTRKRNRRKGALFDQRKILK